MLGVECCDDGDVTVEDERQLVATVSFLSDHMMRLHFDKLQFRVSDNLCEVVAAHALKQG